MRILSYNIHHSSQEKLDKVMRHKADVYILPELANPSQLRMPKGYCVQWVGDNERKGLGILWRSSLRSQLPEWYNPAHKYMLPVLIEDKLIMAAWPTKTNSNHPKSYPQILTEALREYEPYLKQYPTIISGDMNCFCGQQEATANYCLEKIMAFLGALGYVSAYHEKAKEPIGKESVATYYHLFRKNMPFFLDYTFANIPIHSYQLYDWDADVSDHVAQMIEIL